MRFFIRKKRQPPAVIIVALIDVLIVVLIFMMVTTTFKKPQPVLRLALPESSQAKKAGATETPAFELVIEKSGDFRLGPDHHVVPPERLTAELQGAVAKNPQLKVALEVDKGAPVGQLVKVMDAAREAGLKIPPTMSVLPPGQK